MLLLLFLVAGAFAWLAHDRDPVFEGRPLSFWLLELQVTPSESDEDGRIADRRVEAAKRALRSLGPAAVPELLRRIETRDSSVRAFFGDWLNKLPDSTFDPRPRQRARPWAAWAFEIIGPAGSNAVPRLLTLLDGGEDGQEAMRALAGIGAPAVPALREQLSSKDPAAQNHAILLLGHIGPAAMAAAGQLLALATNAAPPITGRAVLALALIGAEAPRVLALASAGLLDTNSADYAAMSLAALGRDGLPILLRGLTNAEPVIGAASVIGMELADQFIHYQADADAMSAHHLRRHIEFLQRLRRGSVFRLFQQGKGERYISVRLTNLHRAFPATSRALAARLMAQSTGQGEIVRPSLDALTGDLDPDVRAAAWDGLWELGPAPPPAPATNAPPDGRRRRRGATPP